MPPQATTTPTCNTCRISDEECTWKRQDDQCDRCIDHGLQCRRPRPARASSIEVKGESTRASTSETEQAAPAVSRSKNNLQCNTCRRHHQTCRPLGRVWPQKCERCIDKGWDCTPPRTKQEYEQSQATEVRMRRPYARRSIAGKSSSTQKQQQTPHDHHTNGRLMLVESDIMAANDGQEEDDQSESLSERDPESSILVGGGDYPAPPTKRQRTGSHINGGGDEGRAAGARATAAAASAAAAATPSHATARGNSSAENDLQKTIRTMEEEFQEVLRMEQERHDAEIRNLKARYEQELVKQRERYEGRIDDLIKIMKSMGRVD